MKRRWLPLAALLGPISGVTAHAEIYMSASQAASAIFPGGKFTAKSALLTEEDARDVKTQGGQTVRSKTIEYWIDERRNVLYVDQVLGKHEFITYAVGISTDGKIAGVEILEYRESYGSQIRKADWRVQFVGKDKHSRLKMNDDIQYASGATISSAHVAAGVKRVLFTHERIKGRL